MRWVLDAACSFFLGAQVEMQKKIRKIPDSFHQVGSKTHAPRHTGTRTHTHVLVENGGDLPGVHIVPTIYIYMHIVRHVPSLLPSLVWCYTWQLSSLRTLSISRVIYIYMHLVLYVSLDVCLLFRSSWTSPVSVSPRVLCIFCWSRFDWQNVDLTFLPGLHPDWQLQPPWHIADRRTPDNINDDNRRGAFLLTALFLKSKYLYIYRYQYWYNYRIFIFIYSIIALKMLEFHACGLHTMKSFLGIFWFQYMQEPPLPPPCFAPATLESCEEFFPRAWHYIQCSWFSGCCIDSQELAVSP